MKSIKDFLGLNLKRIRALRNLNQDEFAHLLGMSKTHLSLLEVGKTGFSYEIIDKIALRLNISPAELFKDMSASPAPDPVQILSIISNALYKQSNDNVSPVDVQLVELFREAPKTLKTTVIAMLTPPEKRGASQKLGRRAK